MKQISIRFRTIYHVIRIKTQTEIGIFLIFFLWKIDDIQSILSQNDSKTAIAENLLKQFGNSNVKQEIEDDRNAVVADSTTNLNIQRPIKCEATSTSRKSPNNLKNEPVIKIESIYETNRKVNFDISMNTKQIQEAVR